MTDTDHNPQAEQTRGKYDPIGFTSDPPTEWRPQPNRAQRREMARKHAQTGGNEREADMSTNDERAVLPGNIMICEAGGLTKTTLVDAVRMAQAQTVCVVCKPVTMEYKMAYSPPVWTPKPNRKQRRHGGCD